MDEARIFKKKCNDWTKLYYKMLKGLKAMINVQRQVRDIMKIAEETNMMITEIKDTIIIIIIIIIIFKSTIYYTGRDGSPCLQEELCMEYQYPNLFMQLPNIQDY